MARDHDLTGTVIGIIGGDRREQEIARSAAAAGASVRAFGFPWPEAGIAGVHKTASVLEAASGARVVLLPLPGMTGDRVFAPASTEPVVVDRAVLGTIEAGGLVVGGAATAQFEDMINSLGLQFAGYEHDKAGRIARSPAIAEGAIARIVQETGFTICGARILLFGFGVIGAQLGVRLRALGAAVHVVARSHAQQAGARAAGLAVAGAGEAEKLAAQSDILINTVPAPMVGPALLAAAAAQCVIVDLASPPGGIDHAAAKAMGRPVVWARGLGATSPVTVGRAQWHVISDIIERHLKANAAHR